MLTLTKHRVYARSGGGFIWRAAVGTQEVATGPDKATATANAWAAIEDLAKCAQHRVHVGVAVDGAVITIREYATGQYELMFHRGADPVRLSGSTECGSLIVDGKPAGVGAMLAHRLAQYNDAVRPLGPRVEEVSNA